MAIRMEKDPEQQPGRSGGGGNTGGGGAGGGLLLKALPLLLMFLIKRPKLLIPVLLIGGVWYFFLGGSEMLSGGGGGVTNQYSLGAALSEEEYYKAEVFEPLVLGQGNKMPASASLLKYVPKRMQQGRQGSCIGWASAYGARTILQAQATGSDPNAVAFSPAYLYNQIALSDCQGAYMQDAMQSMLQNGAVPFKEFPYDERTCAAEPRSNHIQLGRQYRIRGFNRLTYGERNFKPDIQGVKQHLAQGAPVVIGMMVGGTFMSRMVGQKVWYPTAADYAMQGYSGHAMCVIGYDDNLEGGAFHIMNSWGEEWGDRGNAWVRYGDFERFTKEAYGLHPMGKADSKADAGKMAVEFGLLDMGTQKTLQLKQREDIIFQTVRPIRKGDKFKVLIANSIECNVYVFGEEANGSSTVLFPYTDKHSPYCGITGTRLFPKDYSMTADEVGNKDRIAIVVSKQALDFRKLNTAINSSRQRSYAEKLKEALGNQRITNVSFRAGQTVTFEAQTQDKNVVGTVIELDKQ